MTSHAIRTAMDMRLSSKIVSRKEVAISNVGSVTVLYVLYGSK
jgi:hypothetical protein